MLKEHENHTDDVDSVEQLKSVVKIVISEPNLHAKLYSALLVESRPALFSSDPLTARLLRRDSDNKL